MTKAMVIIMFAGTPNARVIAIPDLTPTQCAVLLNDHSLWWNRYGGVVAKCGAERET